MAVNWLSRTVMVGPKLALCLSQKELDELNVEVGNASGSKFLEEGQIAQVISYKNKETGESIAVVCIGGDIGDDALYTIVHEAVHVSDFYFRDMEEDQPAKEERAYVTENIFVALWNEYVARTTKKDDMETNWLDRTMMSGPKMALCLSQEELDAAMKSAGADWKEEFLTGDDVGKMITAVDDDSSRNVVMVCIKPNQSLDEAACTLVHEATHVVDFYFETCIHESKPAHEERAYIMEHVFGKLYYEYKRRTSETGEQ